MTNYKIGQRVEHPVHGECYIKSLDQDDMDRFKEAHEEELCRITFGTRQDICGTAVLSPLYKPGDTVEIIALDGSENEEIKLGDIRKVTEAKENHLRVDDLTAGNLGFNQIEWHTPQEPVGDGITDDTEAVQGDALNGVKIDFDKIRKVYHQRNVYPAKHFGVDLATPEIREEFKVTNTSPGNAIVDGVQLKPGETLVKSSNGQIAIIYADDIDTAGIMPILPPECHMPEDRKIFWTPQIKPEITLSDKILDTLEDEPTSDEIVKAVQGRDTLVYRITPTKEVLIREEINRMAKKDIERFFDRGVTKYRRIR